MKDRPHVRVDGVLRFKANRVVVYLAEHAKSAGADMNLLSGYQQMGMFSKGEYNEFLQLIGYSVSGYEDARVRS